MEEVNVEPFYSGKSKKTILIVAKKRIKKGEELLFCYGAPYWDDKRNRCAEEADVSNFFYSFVTKKVELFNLDQGVIATVCKLYNAVADDKSSAAYCIRFKIITNFYHLLEAKENVCKSECCQNE